MVLSGNEKGKKNVSWNLLTNRKTRLIQVRLVAHGPLVFKTLCYKPNIELHVLTILTESFKAYLL